MISGSIEATASTPTMSAMDANLMAMMDNIIIDPADGQVRKSPSIFGIDTAMDLLQAADPVVDTLIYDDNGTDKDVHVFKKNQLKNLQDFLFNRINLRTLDALGPSTFSLSDVNDFVAEGSKILHSHAIVPQASLALYKHRLLLTRPPFKIGNAVNVIKLTALISSITKCLSLDRRFFNVVNMQGYKRLYDPTFDLKIIRPGDD